MEYNIVDTHMIWVKAVELTDAGNVPFVDREVMFLYVCLSILQLAHDARGCADVVD
jgi:hypothetical protein